MLLLASLNVAGLLLARGAARSGELATRMAIGASRRRLTGQLLVESTLLVVAGGLLGLVVTPLVSSALLGFLTWDRDLVSRFDHGSLLFATMACVVAAGVCAVAPLVQTGRVSLIASLKEQSRVSTSGGAKLRKALVVGQLALTLVLLIAAGLFVQTLASLHTNVGFDGSRLVMFSVSPSSVGYSEQESERTMREVLRSVRESPGVEDAAVANTFLLSGGWSTRPLTIQSDERIVADRPVPYMRVSPGFFPVLGTQVIAGRDFDTRDVRTPGTAPRRWRSAVVNESFVRRYFNGSNPVGHRLGIGDDPGTVTDIVIIGVVRDFSRRRLRDEGVAQVFFPYWDRDSDGGAIYVRVQGQPESAFATLRAAVERVDPSLPATSMRTYADQVDRSVWTERALAAIGTAFALVALLLSVVGLYGVISFVATQRRREIGVRLALGAPRSAAVWPIVREAMVLIVAGLTIALPCSWALQRVVESQLFGVSATDGMTMVAASALMASVAVVAALVPAWRAASASPTEALRLE